MPKVYCPSGHRGAEKTQLTHADACLDLAALLVDRSLRFSRLTSSKVDQLVTIAEATLGARKGDWR